MTLRVDLKGIMEAKQSDLELPHGSTNYLIHRSVLVKEVCQYLKANKITVTTEVKCEQVFTNKNDPSSLFVQFSGTRSNIYNVDRTVAATNDCIRTSSYLPLSSGCEETPMDIDNSNDNVHHNNTFLEEKNSLVNYRYPLKKLKISNTDNVEVCTKLIPVKSETKQASYAYVAVFAAFILLLGIFTMQEDMFIYVNKGVQINNIKEELSRLMVSQEKPIETIMSYLEREWSGINILAFVGSTGVGKTFSVNIIKKHFHPVQVHEIDRNKLDAHEKLPVFINLRRNADNLIIIDNLRADDMDNFTKFVKQLPKSYSSLIIPIFNIQHTDDGLTYHIREDDLPLIKSELDKLNFDFELVLFNTLKLQDVEKWMKMELHKKQVDVAKHTSLMKTVLENSNLYYKGLKSINSKLLIALEQL